MKYISLFLLSFLIIPFGFSQDDASTAPADQYFELIRPEFNGNLAYETVAFVEKYWRVAGNTGFNETIYRIAQELEKAGYVLEEKATDQDRLTYRIENRAMEHPTWEPVSASVAIIGENEPLLDQATNRNMVYLNSFSTPDEGITAEVVPIENLELLTLEKVAGKIVYYEGSVRDVFEEAIVKQGALGIITYDNPDYLQPEKNTSSIQFRGFRPQKETNAWGIALSYAAKEKLKAALKEGKVELKVNIQTKSYPSEELTIVADIKGQVLPKERLVFSAHIQEPGANDNASGVGAQLEMAVLTAKLFKEGKIHFNRSLTYLWGDEIVSTHRYIIEDAIRAKDIKWGISLDMVGENTRVTGGSFLIEKMPDPSAIWTRGEDKHTDWGGDVLKLEDMKPHYLNDFMFKNLKAQGEFANWEVNTNPFEGGSDHTPFLKANIPGLLLWHFTDQFYHTDNDRLDKVSRETLKNVGTGALASALTLVNADTATALNVLNDISEAAKKRMETEYDLSKKSIENGAEAANEIKILQAWEDWYFKTMQTISDMTHKPSKNLEDQIKKAQRQLEKNTKKQIVLLKKG